jgi:YYY domain-containing protein
MTSFISWYFLITLLGCLTFPLAYRLFPALPDRGYTLARTAGLLMWGYIFWLFTSLGISQNDLGGILLALAIVTGLSIWSLVTQSSPLTNWLKENLRVIITTEVLFLLAFAFLAVIRAANPEILGTEKPMELAFINSILRSPTFPPRDPWLSGYAISYYHFGYIITAMIARVTSVPGTLAFNLVLALVFALAGIGAYGIMFNLLALNNRQSEIPFGHDVINRKSPIGLPLLGPLFLLIVSNIEAFFEVLHRLGIFWSNPSTSRFWVWLDIKDLSIAPSQPFAWLPDRYLWWWRASRVVQDYDLAGKVDEIIDEFPFFSFLLGDLHPHVLAIPFGLLAISVALHIYLGASQGSFNLLGTRLHLSPRDFAFAALALGGLAFLNTWDILVGAALIVFAYILFRVHEDGWRWDRFEDLLFFGLPLGVLAVVLYLPFYLSFSSQAGGILPNVIHPTRGTHLWIMFASLFMPILAYLYWSADKPEANWKLSLGLVLGFTFLLWGFSWLIALLVRFADPVFTAGYLNSQGVATIGEFFIAASIRRLANIASLLTLLAILIPAVAYLAGNHQQSGIGNQESGIGTRSFILLLVSLGGLLVLAPDFLYLRDQFGWRLNTIFKFYYQAWILWSLAAAYGMAVLLQNLRGAMSVIFRVMIGLTLILALIYPVLGIWTKTNQFKPFYGYTLDDFDRVARETPDDAAAINWLKSAPEGVVAEAIGGSYTSYARVSTYSGLPTVLGWPGHEDQWRGSHAPQGTREEDIEILYTTSNWETANEIIQKYDIRYIYIGNLERTSMRVQEEKFLSHLKPAFQQGSVVVYEVP